MSTVTETPPATEQPQKTEIASQAKQQPQRLIVSDDSELSFMFDTAKYEQVYRFARLMASGTLVPKHLMAETPEGTIANCFRVTNQALRWELDPFAVADESYVVSGKLGYQGKLVASVVMKHGNLLGRLHKAYSGSGVDRTIEISGRFRDDPETLCTITLSVRQAQTKNEMWTKDPDQKLWYSGVTKWARRNCPEVLLGVLTEDDLEHISEQAPTTQRISLASINSQQPESTVIQDADDHQIAPSDTKSQSQRKEAQRESADLRDTSEQLTFQDQIEDCMTPAGLKRIEADITAAGLDAYEGNRLADLIKAKRNELKG